MKLPQTEVEFYPEVNSQTGLSSFRVSCKRALNESNDGEEYYCTFFDRGSARIV